MKCLLNNLKFAWHYVKDQKHYLWILMISSLIKIILSIITPILSAKIIISLTSNNFQRIILLALVIATAEGISSLVKYISRRCQIKIYRTTLSMLEVELGRNILKPENECLDKKRQWSIYSKINQ